MVILGIDPGTRRVGYGVIKKTGRRTEFVAAGLLNVAVPAAEKGKGSLLRGGPSNRTSAQEPGALLQIDRDIQRLIQTHKPDVLSIEKLFFTKNQKTGMEVAQARGVLLLEAARAGLKIYEYTPMEVKAAIGGYGLADKQAVAKMVRLFLNTPRLKVIDDASDALAIALTAAHRLSTAGG